MSGASAFIDPDYECFEIRAVSALHSAPLASGTLIVGPPAWWSISIQGQRHWPCRRFTKEMA